MRRFEFFDFLDGVTFLVVGTSLAVLTWQHVDKGIALSNQKLTIQKDMTGIGDGICDDDSNNFKLKFDGGDCCLDVDNKLYSNCQDCKCKTLVDEEALIHHFETLMVTKVEDVGQGFQNLILANHSRMTDVKSVEVCSSLCTIFLFASHVNSWVYDGASQTCTCTLIAEVNSSCLFDPDWSITLDLVKQRHWNQNNRSMVAFVQLKKLPYYWKLIMGNFYKFHWTLKHTYSEAVEACKEQGGKLFEPRSLDVMDMVTFYLHHVAPIGAVKYLHYIGITTVNGTRNVYQSDLNLTVGFQHWALNLDRNHLLQKGQCVTSRIYSQGWWYPDVCSRKLDYVCEWHHNPCG